MENNTSEIMVSVPLNCFIQGQLAEERIKAVSEYISGVKYPESSVLYGILGIKRKAEENEPVSM
ncbi:hypothetical protein [Enterocloster lavalensis]|uniref:hypothetical protein n=1 Tax=Enterocloster lavalensis TaxID=460384 RepID=UPI000D1BDF6F|nr:hypothetical protein [Enterocloster lavalensis]PST32548.1 hypothetical protein C7256_15310 [Enterocloster lavalensis]